MNIFRRVVFFFSRITFPSSMQSCFSSRVHGGFVSLSTRNIIRIQFCIRFMRLAGCIPITSRRAKDAVRTAAEKINEGEIVCLFPEGQLCRSGTLLRLQRGYELIARPADAPVVPVWLDRLWGSIFSFTGGRFFSKWPRQCRIRSAVDFGTPFRLRGRHRHRARTITEARRTLLRPATDLASAISA